MKEKLSDVILIMNNSRRSGKTTKAAEWCKEHNGIMLCATHATAKLIAKEHGVETISLENLKKLEGGKIPSIFDNSAVSELLTESLEAILKLEGSESSLLTQVKDLSYRVASLELSSESLEKENANIVYEMEKIVIDSKNISKRSRKKENEYKKLVGKLNKVKDILNKR